MKMDSEINLLTKTASLWNNDSELLYNQESLERIIDDNNLLLINFLKLGVEKAKSVAYIQLPNGKATGFLVSKDLLLTNNHVFPEAETASQSKIIFNYEDDMFGNPELIDEYLCNPEKFFWTNKSLDYSIVKVNKNGTTPGNRWGHIPLLHQQIKLESGQSVNIIQHPKGRKK
jgi:V8-like Glu-specific endopeptidase